MEFKMANLIFNWSLVRPEQPCYFRNSISMHKSDLYLKFVSDDYKRSASMVRTIMIISCRQLTNLSLGAAKISCFAIYLLLFGQNVRKEIAKFFS